MAIPTDTALTQTRPRADYTSAEREFSCLLRQRLEDVLQGKRDRLEVLRKYPNDPFRLGVIPTPEDFPRGQLRLPTVEQLTWDVLTMVGTDATGGPIAQASAPDGSILEVQTFPTRYPHIVIERTDHFVDSATAADAITWSLHRVQTPPAHIQLNHVLDATHLLFDLVRFVR